MSNSQHHVGWKSRDSRRSEWVGLMLAMVLAGFTLIEGFAGCSKGSNKGAGGQPGGGSTGGSVSASGGALGARDSGTPGDEVGTDATTDWQGDVSNAETVIDSSHATDGSGSGGMTTVGDASGSGGTTAVGDASGSGGVTTVGGTSGSGGKTASGGTLGSGGLLSSGGSSTSGGSTGVGGTIEMGGAMGSGGTGVAGTTGTGGGGNGGIPGSGGTGGDGAEYRSCFLSAGSDQIVVLRIDQSAGTCTEISLLQGSAGCTLGMSGGGWCLSQATVSTNIAACETFAPVSGSASASAASGNLSVAKQTTTQSVTMDLTLQFPAGSGLPSTVHAQVTSCQANCKASDCRQ